MRIVPSFFQEMLEEHKDFFWTLFSNSGARFVDGDTVPLYNTKKLLVKDATGEEIPLYDLSFGDKKDKYSIFLGGNAPLITIENTENQDAPTILLIKDSYSNSLVPLLSNNFSKIYVWDLRFNKTSIKEYIKSENIDNVLVLYSTENFSTDSNLFFLER